jgi:hypothetical protein
MSYIFKPPARVFEGFCGSGQVHCFEKQFVYFRTFMIVVKCSFATEKIAQVSKAFVDIVLVAQAALNVE